MRVALKILGGAAALLVLLLIGIVVAVKAVDVNTFIGPLQQRIKAATGRDLTVRGGADLALSLQPKLVLSDVAFGNASWGSAPAMVAAQRLELTVALMPLLSRRFELVELTLVKPVIALEASATGQKNWEFGPSAAPPKPATPTAAPSAAAAFGVGNVVITDGTLTYRNAATGSATHVAIDRLFLRARDPQTPIATQFKGKVDDVALALEGTLGPLETLMEKRWPYPISLQGDVQQRNAAFVTNLRVQDDVYALDDLKVTLGPNTLTGKVSVATSGPRPKVVFTLSAPALTLAELLAPVAAGKAPAAAKPAARESGRLFPDTPVDLASLRSVDAQGGVTVGKLVLANGRQLDNVRAQIALNAGVLNVAPFDAMVFGGTMTGSLAVDARQPNSESLTLRLDGKALALASILAAVGHQRDLRGGKTDIAINLAMRGSSPRGWASTANGRVQAVVGPTTAPQAKGDPESPLDKLLTAVNPLRTRDPMTEITCIVVRLPLADGIARIDRSLAAETSTLDVAASGTLDFRNETLDLAIAPRIKQGIPIEIPNLAQLVRFTGPFASPRIAVDPVGSAAAIASIGAAVGTGGLSAVGQSLLARRPAGGPGPCQVALGQGGSATSGATTPGAPAPKPTVPNVEEIGKAIGKLFGR